MYIHFFREFYIEGNRIVDFGTNRDITTAGNQLILASDTIASGVEFETENLGTGETGLTVEDLLGNYCIYGNEVSIKMFIKNNDRYCCSISDTA